jgi:hypothetical protein
MTISAISDIPPAPPADTSGAGELSRRSRALLAVITTIIAVVTAIQLVTIFLEAAPSNTISQRYATQLSWWVEPWFEENWQLFAPNPMSGNLTVQARARTVAGVVTPWVDIGAVDYAATRHDPMPSHVNQNELRRAWFAYAAALPGSGVPNTAEGRMLQQYVVNIAASRLSGSVPGPYDTIQLQATMTPIPAPGSTTTPVPSTQTTLWLPVSGGAT